MTGAARSFVALVLVAGGACGGSSGGPVVYEHLPVEEEALEEALLTEPQADLVVDFAHVPERFTRGEGLRYVVLLRNTGVEPVSLTPCPAYYQAWGESGTAVSRTSYLNCDDAPGAVAPGAAVRFEMELPVGTQDVAAGFEGILVWYLGHPGGDPRGELINTGWIEAR